MASCQQNLFDLLSASHISRIFYFDGVFLPFRTFVFRSFSCNALCRCSLTVAGLGAEKSNFSQMPQGHSPDPEKVFSCGRNSSRRHMSKQPPTNTDSRSISKQQSQNTITNLRKELAMSARPSVAYIEYYPISTWRVSAEISQG